MPYPSEHSARVRDPGDFEEDSFRSEDITDGVRIIIGKLKGESTMTTQAYRFDSEMFTVSEAKQWLEDNNVDYISFTPAGESDMEEKATLKIYGDIGADGSMDIFSDSEMISAKKVSDFIDEHPDAKEIVVRINSRGGDVQEGWAIHDLLVNSGKKIKTIGEGKVYSIATVIFLAGEEREIMANADGQIHNPYIPPYTLADKYESGDLLKIAETLIQEEEKMLDFYVKRTGSPKEKLADYMKQDTKLSAEDMLSLGFATKIVEPIQAYAFINYKISNKYFEMDQKEKKSWGEKLDLLLEKVKNLSRLPVTDMQSITDKDGKTFELQKDSGSPAVGDKASPDGTYVLADGKTIVIESGAITEIKEPEMAKTELELALEEINSLKSKVATLESANADLQGKIDSVNAKEQELETVRTEMLGLVGELKSLKNDWKPEGRKKISNVDKVGSVDLNKVREISEKLEKIQ